ncbi:MAG: glutamine-synthetase adenylyltransferase, partial [Hyphomonadaceae bacterium]
MNGLAGISAAAPAPADAATEADSIAADSPWRDVARAGAHHAPYLARIMRLHPHLVENMDAEWAARTRDDAIAEALAIARAPPPLDEGMKRLRDAKKALHLAAALADLSRRWPLQSVTSALTQFADASLAASIALAARVLGERGDIEAAPFDDPHGPIPGIAFIAMGKMGAGELNYSSDVDFSVFYEPAEMKLKGGAEARAVALRVVQIVVKALEEISADGYVFR